MSLQKRLRGDEILAIMKARTFEEAKAHVEYQPEEENELYMLYKSIGFKWLKEIDNDINTIPIN